MRTRSAQTESPVAQRSQSVRRIDLSAVELASSESARDINRDIVLELVRFRQPLSRVELARASGLQPSTVSIIVEQLITEGWVKEGATVYPPRGRPSKMLEVSDHLVTFALDIRPDRAILAVVDLSGRLLSRETVMTVSRAQASVNRILERLHQMRSEHPDKTFQGIGVSVPGRVHPVTQRLLMAPNLPWESFDLRRALQQSLKLQVEIENDANACLLAEAWYGRLAGACNVVLVAVSEGLGTAILSGGQLHNGFNGMAGEFGHIAVDPAGPVCGCGQRGCWEMMASSRAALRFYRESKSIRPKARDTDIYTLLRLAEENDAAAIEAITRQAEALGKGMRLLLAALSPETILVVGELTSSWKRFGPIVEREMRRTLLAGTPPRLVAGGDGELARLLGAAAVFMQRHASYHRSTRTSKANRRIPTAVRPHRA